MRSTIHRAARRNWAVCLAAALSAGGAIAEKKPPSPASSPAPDLIQKARLTESYGRLPLAFEPNRGQVGAGEIAEE